MMDALGVPRAISSTYISKLVEWTDEIGYSQAHGENASHAGRPVLEPLPSLGGQRQTLPTKDLRLKTICLLALVLMLRPSDIAPHGRYMNPPTMVVE